MCGIAAILLFPEQRPVEIWQEIKENFKKNLIANQDRGWEATGVAIVQKDGWIDIEKEPLCPTEFIATDKFSSMMSLVRSETTLLLGHTRKPTKGTPEDPHNNHPVQAGSVFGVHNGVVKNDDELFASCTCERQGEVDSEIIFRMIEQVNLSTDSENYVAEVINQLKKMDGKITFLSTDLRNPSQLFVMKHQNPLSIHYHQKWNALIFSSRYAFLRKTFGTEVITEVIPSEKLLLYDAMLLPDNGIRAIIEKDL